MIKEPLKARPVKWWEVALLTVAVTVLSRLLTGNPQRQDQQYYEKKTKQVAWAPPGWVFGPAWTINNIFLLKALLELLRNRKDLPERRQLLVLQALIWTVFLSFGYFYFRRRSSLLGGAITVTDAVLAIASYLVARRGDKRLAAHYLPLLVWTCFASTLAVPQALRNDDQLFGTKALIDG